MKASRDRTRRAGTWLIPLVGGLVLIGSLTGFGFVGGSQTSPVTEARKVLSVKSPALTADGLGEMKIPNRFQCRENAIWLPLRWSKIPGNTSEVVVVISVSRIKRKQGSVTTAHETEWVVGGLGPDQRMLKVGAVPKGAFMKGHEVGIPDCPSRLHESGMVFAVYALPRPGFHPTRTERISSATVALISESAVASGLTATLYGSQ